MELVGPIHNINFPTDEASHFLGILKNSSSTLSQGIAVHERSYIKFKNISCTLIIGKKGINALAASTENIFPKFDEAVIFIYFIILAYVLRPSTIPSSSTMRSFSKRIISADSLAISTAVSTDIPISAAFIAAASFIPSPIKPTV